MAGRIVNVFCEVCDGKGGRTRPCPTLAERDGQSLPAIGGAVEFVKCSACEGRGYVEEVM